MINPDETKKPYWFQIKHRFDETQFAMDNYVLNKEGEYTCTRTLLP